MVRLSDEQNPFRQDLMKATHTAPEQLLFMAAEAVAWQEGSDVQLRAVVEDLRGWVALLDDNPDPATCHIIGFLNGLKGSYEAELEEDNGQEGN